MLKLPVNRSLTRILLGCMCAAGLLASAPFWGRGLLPEDVAYGYAPMAGVLLSLPCFVALCLLVRCRSCEDKLFWRAVARRHHSGGLRWFLSANTCPRCGAWERNPDA